MTYVDYLEAVKQMTRTNHSGLCLNNTHTLHKLPGNIEHHKRLKEAIYKEVHRLNEIFGNPGHDYLHTLWNLQRATPMSDAEAQLRRIELLDAWISMETCMDPLAPMRKASDKGCTVWHWSPTNAWQWVSLHAYSSLHPFDCTTVAPPSRPVSPPDPHAELKLAHKRGEQIEFQNSFGGWSSAPDPEWLRDVVYRIAAPRHPSELLEAWEDGLDVQWAFKAHKPRIWDDLSSTPVWNFEEFDYRVTPKQDTKFQDLKRAHRAGKTIEVQLSGTSKWVTTAIPAWELDSQYRIKPETVSARLFWRVGPYKTHSLHVATAKAQKEDPREAWSDFAGWASEWLQFDPSTVTQPKDCK